MNEPIASLSAEELEALGFEQALERLTAVAKALDQGGLTVDQTIRLYESGMKLAKLCNVRLDQAEQRITRLQASDVVPEGELGE